MPDNFLAAFQTGANLVQEAQNMRAKALNMQHVQQTMQQQAQMFPLELQQLQTKGALESLNIQMMQRATADDLADKTAIAAAVRGKSPIELLDVPMPELKTDKAIRAWTLMRKDAGDTLSGMTRIEEAIDAIKQKSPVYQTQLATQQARLEAEKSRQTYYQTRPTGARSYAPTAGIKEAQYADELDAKAAEAEDAGDEETAANLRSQAATFRAKLEKSAGKAPLTLSQRISLEAHIASLSKQMADLDKTSEEYKTMKRLLDNAQSELAGKPDTGLVPPKVSPPPVANPKDPADLLRFFK